MMQTGQGGLEIGLAVLSKEDSGPFFYLGERNSVDKQIQEKYLEYVLQPIRISSSIQDSETKLRN